MNKYSSPKLKIYILSLVLLLTLMATAVTGCTNNEALPNEGSESGSESGNEGSGHSENNGEAGDPASPVLSLTENWDGVVNGIRVAMSYNSKTRSFSGDVENVTNKTIKAILIELNLKQGQKTVVELGPFSVGDLAPGQKAFAELYVDKEPEAKGITFDAWQIHPEAEGKEANEAGHGAEGSEGSGGEGNHGSEGSEGSEGNGGSDEAAAMTLTKTDKYDVNKNGAHLVIAYDKASNSFKGTVKNTTNATLTRVRVEIHLDNGTELGPTTPTDLAPGKTLNINLPATTKAFTKWSTHAEMGASEGNEGSGEHGSNNSGGEGSEGNHGKEGSGGN